MIFFYKINALVYIKATEQIVDPIIVIAVNFNVLKNENK